MYVPHTLKTIAKTLSLTKGSTISKYARFIALPKIIQAAKAVIASKKKFNKVAKIQRLSIHLSIFLE
jgi:hypothetical protein